MSVPPAGRACALLGLLAALGGPGPATAAPPEDLSNSTFPEGSAGAWQRGLDLRTENVLTFYAVYSCVTLIASDISKLRIKLMQQDATERAGIIRMARQAGLIHKADDTQYLDFLSHFATLVKADFLSSPGQV